jgi:hypothetical protein
MDLLMVLFLAFAMCMMLSSVVAGGYALLNKQQATESQPLLSAEDLDKLAGQLDEAGNSVQYSNVLDARIGFDSGSGVIKTASLAPPDCQTLCVGTTNCQGFQISDQNGCDLLANVTSTYGFVESGINLFAVSNKIPLQVFGAANLGEISGKDVARAPSASPAPSEVYTKHECAKRCHDTPGCKSFSMSATDGCRPKSARNAGDATLIMGDDWNSYFLKDVKHTNGFSWTPAPSPSPA